MTWYLKVGNSRIRFWDGKKRFQNFYLDESPFKKLSQFIHDNCDEILMLSVVPPVQKKLVKICKKHKVRLVPVKIENLNFAFAYRNGLGLDRALNIWEVAHRLTTSFVLVDVGTAVTVEFVKALSAKRGKVHLGGWIVAGPRFQWEALSQRSALLPSPKLKAQTALIGRSSSDCLNAGLRQGVIGLIHQAEKVAKILGMHPYKVVLTGGDAPKHSKAHLIPDLALMGLKRFNSMRNKGFGTQSATIRRTRTRA